MRGSALADADHRAAAEAALAAARTLHAPVLLDEVVAALAPERGGVFLDGTFGAGGYARAILEAGADRVIGLDRDGEAIARAALWAPLYGDRLALVETAFSGLDAVADDLDGVALDLGVSSMQLDAAARGFSFAKDGPLDMRMGADARRSAADLVNGADEATLADILFHYGEERAARRIAKRIVAARAEAPIETTLRLSEIVEGALPRQKPGQAHPATRSFQALRIAVNAEFDELLAGLAAAERALKPGGVLAVVSFHSLEDRIVKRFFAERARPAPAGSRHAPDAAREGSVNDFAPTFAAKSLKPVGPGDAEVARNPRARSAKLRWARRTEAPARPVDGAALGAPRIPAGGRRGG